MGDGTTATRATRVDDVSGIREEVEFIGSGERIFSTLHAPVGEPIGAVLLCSSILAELLAGYQEEVWLCRRLAERGFAVRRFHYRGTGHSDGEAEDVTFERACEDAAAVAEHLDRETAGTDRFAFVGTRVGAMIAATLASRFPGAPTAFIEPILEGDKLFREVGRSRFIWLSREEGSEGAPPPEDMLAILERDRSVDVLGYRLNDRLYGSVRSQKLVDNLGAVPRPVMLVQVGKRKAISGENQRFLDDLATRGFATTATAVNDEIAWWFHDTRRHLIPEIGDAIVPWLAELLAKEGTRR